MTVVTWGGFTFDTEQLKGRGFQQPYVIDGVTYEYETAMRVAHLLEADALVARADQHAAAAGGAVSSVRLTWDGGTTDADPGAGKARASTAALTAGSYTLYLSTTDVAGEAVAALLDAFAASTSTAKGRLRIAHRTDSGKWIDLNVTSVTAAASYRKVAVTYVAGPAGWVGGDPVALGFIAAGDTVRWRSGTGAPAAGTGNDEDYYLDTTAGDIYRKTAGAWGAALIRIKGTNGATWYSGSGAPAAGTGVNGDFYFSTAGDIYQKAGGAWGSPITNLTGPQGPSGSNKVCEGGTAGGTANAPTMTASPAFTGARGEMLVFATGGSDNTGAVNITANGVSLAARKNGSAMTGGELPANTRVALVSTGTYLELISGGASLPSQTGNAGKVLITNGTAASWGSVTPALPLTTVAGTSQSMAVNNGYVANNASRVTLTLPSVAAVGDAVEVYSLGAGGWKVAQNAGQSIIYGAVTTVAGVTDGLMTNGANGYVRLVCVVANTTWEATNVSGAVQPVLVSTQTFDAATINVANGGGVSLSGANLVANFTVSAASHAVVRTAALPNAGKWYAEFYLNSLGTNSADYAGWGISTAAGAVAGALQNTGMYTLREQQLGSNVYLLPNGANAGTVGLTLAAGNTIGIAVDMDAQKLWFSINNTYIVSGNPAAGTNPAATFSAGTYYLFAGIYNAYTGSQNTYRPSPANWVFNAPSGFSRLA